GVMLGALLAGCGVTAPAPSGALAATTATPMHSASATLNGCPAQHTPAGAKTADVVVATGGGETSQTSRQTVHLTPGQTLEIRLLATFRWVLAPGSWSSILSAPTGNGWFDNSLKACVWQFTATQSGEAALSYGGGPICTTAGKCPNVMVDRSYTVDVGA